MRTMRGRTAEAQALDACQVLWESEASIKPEEGSDFEDTVPERDLDGNNKTDRGTG